MKKAFYLLILGVFLAMGTWLITTDASAADYTVCDTDCDYENITEAVADVSSGDTLLLSAQTYSEGDEVIIHGKDLTIRGEGMDQTIIDGEATYRLFFIGEATVVFEDLTIQNGKPPEDVGHNGRGVFIDDEANDVTFVNCRLTHNQTGSSSLGSSGAGGAISHIGGALTIIDSEIIENDYGVSDDYVTCGAGIFIGSSVDPVVIIGSIIVDNNNGIGSLSTEPYGSGICSHVADLLIEDSVIDGNHSGVYGGGIYFENDFENTLEITNSTISGNLLRNTGESSIGGGLYTHGGANIEISDSAFYGNSADYSGGGLFINGSQTLNFTRNSVYANETRNAAGAGGGMNILVKSEEGEHVISDSTFYGNTAAFGGGLRIHSDETTAKTEIYNSTFSGNTTPEAGWYGGGILSDGGGVIDLVNSTVTNNRAKNDGGGIFVLDGDFNLLNTIVINNQVTSGDGDDLFAALGETFTDIGPNIIGSNDSVEAFFVAGLPNDNGSYIGSDAEPIDVATVIDDELADNGGPTLTHALVSDSLGIDSGQTLMLPDDQRGVARPQKDAYDIGAYEYIDAAITTKKVTNITKTSATSGGTITNTGVVDFDPRGVCWSTSPDPTLADDCTDDGDGDGAYTSQLSGLQENTTYYVRAYTTYIDGTIYGENKEFKTAKDSISVTTAISSAITNNSAKSGGTVSVYGYTVSDKGVCWSQNTNPTTTDTCLSAGSGAGSFNSSLTNLSADTTYNVRAYADYNNGTIYGQNKSFTTEKDTPPPPPIEYQGFVVNSPQQNAGPQIRVWDGEGKLLNSFWAYGRNLRGQFTAITGNLRNSVQDEIITFPGAGLGPHLKVFKADGTLLAETMVYNSNFRGGLNATVGDFNGDGLKEIAVAPLSQGGPQVKIYRLEGRTLKLMAQLWAYDKDLRGSFNMVAANVDNSDRDTLAIVPKSGHSSLLKLFKYENGRMVNKAEQLVYDRAFRGGVNLTAGDFNGNGHKEIITAPAANGGPNIRMYSYQNGSLKLLDWLFAYDRAFRGGVNVTAGDLTGNSIAELVVTPASKGGPNLQIYRWQNGKLSIQESMFVYDRAFRGGVNTTIGDLNLDGRPELITAPTFPGASNIRIYTKNNKDNLELQKWFYGYDPKYHGGTMVAAGIM